MKIRERLEQIEKNNLSEFAQLSSNTKGRMRNEKEDNLRTAYMRDRDRIVHCKSFRRLIHKTQVFFAPRGDHYRTRLTHTLEVSQISRTIAKVLRLNEELTEAIALGHDLGHTPFGHIGEEALTQTGKLKEPFNHNEQSLRVVDFLEYKGKGLNLTYEVRDGILNHTGPVDPQTVEGKIVKIADRIAYVNHDIDDAVRAKLLTIDDLPMKPISLLGKYPSQRIGALVGDMIEQSNGSGDILFSPKILKAFNELRKFMFDNIYNGSPAKLENEKVLTLIKNLFEYYFKNPGQMPREFQPATKKDLAQSVCDYVSGMSDRYALDQYSKLFLPKTWQD